MSKKIYDDPTYALSRIERWKNKNRTVVFTNGCFDILHFGHLTYLKEAKKLGNKLIIGVNTDSSVKTLKGDDRPINSTNHRMAILDALDFVDMIIPFSEETPLELIKIVKPDIIVKGGDYRPDQVVGKDFVEEYGGEVKILSLVEDISTTKIIDKIRKWKQ